MITNPKIIDKRIICVRLQAEFNPGAACSLVVQENRLNQRNAGVTGVQPAAPKGCVIFKTRTGYVNVAAGYKKPAASVRSLVINKIGLNQSQVCQDDESTAMGILTLVAFKTTVSDAGFVLDKGAAAFLTRYVIGKGDIFKGCFGQGINTPARIFQGLIVFKMTVGYGKGSANGGYTAAGPWCYVVHNGDIFQGEIAYGIDSPAVRFVIVGIVGVAVGQG